MLQNASRKLVYFGSKGQGSRSQVTKTLPAWVFALLWVLAPSNSMKRLEEAAHRRLRAGTPAAWGSGRRIKWTKQSCSLVRQCLLGENTGLTQSHLRQHYMLLQLTELRGMELLQSAWAAHREQKNRRKVRTENNNCYNKAIAERLIQYFLTRIGLCVAGFSLPRVARYSDIISLDFGLESSLLV